MRSFFALVNREFKSYFNSPIAYIALIIFQLLSALLFFQITGFFMGNRASLDNYFMMVQILFCVLIPALTMRSWAEERKQRTDEVLVTLPFSEFKLVMGKFLGAFSLVLIAILITLAMPLTVIWLGDFDIQILISQYIGIVLIGSVSLTLGMFISSLCKNQITAFLISFIILFLMLALWPMLKNIQMPGFFSMIFNFFSFSFHFESFSKGLLNSRDFIYLVGMSLLFLYLNVTVIRFRKWN